MENNMIITPHLLVGAVIGLKIKRIGWIILIGIFSHFVLDMIPHWDYGNGLLVNGLFFDFFLRIILDGLIGLAIILFFLKKRRDLEKKQIVLIFIGAISAILPDILVHATILLDGFLETIFNWFIYFHQAIHCSLHIFSPTLLGVGTQVLVGLIAIIILFRHSLKKS